MLAPQQAEVSPTLKRLSSALVPRPPLDAYQHSGLGAIQSSWPSFIEFLPIGSVGGYKSDHPYFMNTPYVLPSGTRVTDDYVSRPTHSLVAGLFKNSILRPKVLGALKKSSFGQSLRLIREEWDSAILRRTKRSRSITISFAREKSFSSHAASEGKLNSELEDFLSNLQGLSSKLEMDKADLATHVLLEERTTERDNLSSHITEAE
ncbi:hypothetical protein LIER_32166 [Lithospermum erythrorhizon]|uniref:Uncharacterized protein n=1 Tax=Lithospermum erythrorhizon TaxID=34254 RepID=A0AAV3RT48_LITER